MNQFKVENTPYPLMVQIQKVYISSVGTWHCGSIPARLKGLFFSKVSLPSLSPLSILFNVYREQSGWGVWLTTCLLLELRLRMSGTIPPLFMSSWGAQRHFKVLIHI